MRYLLTRKGDGHTNHGTLIATKDLSGVIEFGVLPTEGKRFCVLNDNLKGRQTSLVVAVKHTRPDKVEFLTENSVYELEIAEGAA